MTSEGFLGSIYFRQMITQRIHTEKFFFVSQRIAIVLALLLKLTEFLLSICNYLLLTIDILFESLAKGARFVLA